MVINEPSFTSDFDSCRVSARSGKSFKKGSIAATSSYASLLNDLPDEFDGYENNNSQTVNETHL